MKSSSDLQEVVLISLLKDSYLLSTASEDIKPDFFSNLEYRVIYQALVDFYKDYDKLPDRRSLCVCIADIWDKSFNADIKDVKRKVNEFYKEDPPDEDFAIDKITVFIKRRKVERALTEIVTNMQDNDGEFEEGIEVAAEELLESIQVNLSKGELFKMDNLESIHEARMEAVGTDDGSFIIKSSINSINRKLQFNGYKPGDLVLFVSPPGVGKTSFMINEGAHASKTGHRVLHIFIGDMTNYDGFIRYAATFSGENQNSITKMNVEDQFEFVKKRNLGGNFSRLSMLSYPAESLTVDQLIENVSKCQEEEGVHYDMIVIDYPDNLIPEDPMMYQSSGIIFNKLSYLARTNNSVVLAGSQPKQEFWGQEIIPKKAAAESSKKQQIIDVMLTMGKFKKTGNLATIYMAKVRRGEDGALIRARTDWSKCRIEELSSEEYQALKAEIE